MHIIKKLIFIGLVISFIRVKAEDPNEKARQEWRKRIKDNYFHLKKARKNMEAALAVLRCDVEIPISRKAKELASWTIDSYFDYLAEHRKLYNT